MQQYYQLLSTAGTATNNKLTDYFSAIVEGILKNLHGLVLMFLPLIFLLVFGKKLLSFRPKPLIFGGFTLVLTLVFHLLALLMVESALERRLPPKMVSPLTPTLMITVEQLGIITMLRLDIKHTLFGSSASAVSTEDLDKLNSLAQAESTPTPETTDHRSTPLRT